MIRAFVSHLSLALGWALSSPTAIAQGGSMRIESCNLGCSSGAGGAQVSCSLVLIEMNQDLRIRFTRPVDPATLTVVTLLIFDHNSGAQPIGTRFVDPADPNTVVFRPSFSIDAAGDPQFGFEAFHTYRIQINGVSQGDPPPYIRSLDADQLPNRTRMQCDVQVTGGFSSPGIPYCAGDGLDPAVTTPCPCANVGSPGRGCANSTPASRGANLFALGTVSPDTVSLYSTSMPNPTLMVFLQGNQSVSSGVPFGDGIRCISGTIVRLGVRNAAGGASYPLPGDPPITARSAARGDPIAPGTTRNYQAWYRDAVPGFCPSPPGGDSNVSNAVRITW